MQLLLWNTIFFCILSAALVNLMILISSFQRNAKHCIYINIVPCILEVSATILLIIAMTIF